MASSPKDPITLKNLTDILPLKISWVKILRTLVDFEIDEDFMVYLVRPDLLIKMFELFDTMDNRLFANIFHTRFLSEFYQTFSLYYVTVFENANWGIAKAQQRFEQCVRIVRTHLPVAFTSLLIKRYTDKRMIDDAYDIANRTMEIIIKDVKEDDSLPIKHKEYMLDKLTTLKFIFGYPKELLIAENIDGVYKNLNLTGNESFLKLVVETFTFSKNQALTNYIKKDNSLFERNETTRWIDYTTEDEYETPLYELNIKNTICKRNYVAVYIYNSSYFLLRLSVTLVPGAVFPLR